jgi:hypothetical protein
MGTAPSEPAASIRKMLTRVARSRGETPEAVFLRFGRERLLSRLSRSHYRERFILKGASLFYVWTDEPHRPTKDIDLLGFGLIDVQTVADIFRSVCAVSAEDDGIEFHADSVSTDEIREDSDYGGVRVKLLGMFAGARLHMQVDVAVGDAVTPAAELIDYPAVLPSLGLEPAHLRAYPKETVVAEKTQTLVKLGMINSRMKDYYDLAEIAGSFPFQGALLVESLKATFARRTTALPHELPIGLIDAFAEDVTKRTQWEGFLRRSDLRRRDLGDVVQSIRGFVWPPLEAAGRGKEFAGDWTPGGPWS